MHAVVNCLLGSELAGQAKTEIITGSDHMLIAYMKGNANIQMTYNHSVTSMYQTQEADSAYYCENQWDFGGSQLHGGHVGGISKLTLSDINGELRDLLIGIGDVLVRTTCAMRAATLSLSTKESFTVIPGDAAVDTAASVAAESGANSELLQNQSGSSRSVSRNA